MVHFVKPIVDYVRGLSTSPLEFTAQHPFYKLLFQDEELAVLATALMDLIPVTNENLRYNSKSIKQVKLTQLVERMTDVSGKMLPDSRFSTSLAQVELEQIRLWNFECTTQDPYASKTRTYNYFDLIADTIYRVAFMPKMQLLTCALSKDHEKIYLNLEWRGPFRNIESLSISGATQPFWYATCDSEDAALSLNMLRYFLYLQVDTVWSENKWSPGKIEQNGNLTASMQFPRAASLELPFELPLSETVAENASNFIVRQFYPKHIEISEKLEVKLREELERRQQYVAQGLLRSQLVDQISRWIEELIAYRKAYQEEISRQNDTASSANH